MTTEELVGLIQRRDSTGRKYHCYQWRDSAGRRHTKSLKHLSTEEAKKVARELDKKRRNGGLGVLELGPNKCTLEQLRQRMLQDRKGRIEDNSLARYDTALRMLIADLGQTYPLRSLTVSKLTGWASQRLQFGGRAGKGMKPAGVNADLRHIRTALNLAHEWSLLERVPSFRTVWLKDPSKGLARHLEPHQVDAILDAETNPDWRRLWVVHFLTGCRRRELYNLMWTDISWEPRPMAQVLGKGGKQRWVPLLPPAVAALGKPKDIGPVFVFRRDPVAAMPPMECLRCLAKQYSKVELGREFGHSDVAIGRWLRLGYPEPKRMHIDTITKRFKRAAIAAGLPDTRLHDARHTTLTYLLSKGVRARLAQEIAGHASIVTTEGYAKHLVDVALYDEAAEALGFSTTKRQHLRVINRDD